MKGILGITGLALGLGLFAGPAMAAPQILGVVAGTVPLGCDDSGCRAEASTFCLQEGRPMPDRGTAYAPVNADELTLVVTTAAGQTQRIPAEGLVALTSARGFAAMSISLPRAAMEVLGATTVAVEIHPDSVLVPVPQAGDPHPQTPADIALAANSLRQNAAAFFDGADPRAQALRFANVIVNALPEQGRTALDRDGDSGGALLRGAMSQAPDAAASAEGMALITDIHGQCARSVTAGFKFSLRRCFEAAHDRLAWALNRDYWATTSGY